MEYFLILMGAVITIGSFVQLKKYHADAESARICKAAIYIGIAIWVTPAMSLLAEHHIITNFSWMHLVIILGMFQLLAHFLWGKKRS